MLNEFETFLTLFIKLKQKVNDSPTILQWLSEQKSDVRRIAFLLGESAEKIRINQAKKPEKYQVVPQGFITAWNNYEKKYSSPITQIVAAERKAGVETFITELKEIASMRGEDFDSILNNILSEIESKKQLGDLFDPLKDDPVSLIEDILLTYEDVINAGIIIDEASDKAVGAWRFFDSVLGLDHRGIYDRWKQIPELLIPSHVLRINTQPIFDLYNEAVRCYVFGNRIAAISMCRALLEHILSNHYRIEAQDLDKMITVAEIKYQNLRKLRMHDKRKLANRIMHDYENKPHVENKLVIDFLKTIQTLIHNIPKNA